MTTKCTDCDKKISDKYTQCYTCKFAECDTCKEVKARKPYTTCWGCYTSKKESDASGSE